MSIQLTTELVLRGYRHGIFPMADDEGRISFYSADPRAIIDLTTFHVPRTLRQVYRQGRFEVTVDHDFPAVIAACADRPEGTWISAEIIRLYTELHEQGVAHSVEAYYEGDLAGGLYGVNLGGGFFGESMFHWVTDASKVALVYLVKRMVQRAMVLLDVQFMTEHLRQFGTVEIPHLEYMRCLESALKLEVRFA
ncbi:MAG: leucyl/phenylalanyl-tRNA--protein transferase [bacterium]|nr:leucyl/phenylalanyl-tRNA--protein transferase [bacterium]